jgi:fumarate reductase flavoprotein subunit
MPAGGFPVQVPIVIIGAGAAGLCAALAAHEAGAELIVLERDSVPRGSTALSAGLLPAAGTRFQKALDIKDSHVLFASDINRKSGGEVDAAIVDMVAREAASTVEWLADSYGFPFSLVNDFDYPGHSLRRMHGLPSRSGEELIDRLRRTSDEAQIPLLVNAAATAIYVGAEQIVGGVEFTRPDATRDCVGCRALILACDGFGGAPDLVTRHIPEMRGAHYFGHPGNRGDALMWGESLGAKFLHMSGYQGHGSVAHPHAVLITWAVIMEGGFQVNTRGVRFSDESRGYSEQAALVLAQPGGLAYDIFDERIAAIARQFADFRHAEAAGAVIEAPGIALLADRLHLPGSAFTKAFAEVEQVKQAGGIDRFGRSFAGVMTLSPPFKAVKVTGALFHTQGGLAVDEQARVIGAEGRPLPNLFAAGGAAAGVSGSKAGGYLSGNGLLMATVLGRIAGRSAASLLRTARAI